MALGSDRGQAGLVVGGVVLAAIFAAERFLFDRPLPIAVQDVGLGRPRTIGVIAALLVMAVLICCGAVVLRAIGAPSGFIPGWGALLPGLFMQAGVAEETLFRGFLYGHIREGRTFWHAATLSAAPFVAVHLTLFATMAWPVALAALLLALILSFPLAHLYELGGDTIWAPALLHFAIQTGAKIPSLSDDSRLVFSLLWMLGSAASPQLLFLIPRDRA
jgi:membrane protease YdiL (CAAX protease family)